jgi:hypothetical protein
MSGQPSSAGHVERIMAGMVGWRFEDMHDVTRLTLVQIEQMI